MLLRSCQVFSSRSFPPIWNGRGWHNPRPLINNNKSQKKAKETITWPNSRGGIHKKIHPSHKETFIIHNTFEGLTRRITNFQYFHVNVYCLSALFLFSFFLPFQIEQSTSNRLCGLVKEDTNSFRMNIFFFASPLCGVNEVIRPLASGLMATC